MKYETPELVVLSPAIAVIQNSKGEPIGDPSQDVSPAYQDSED